MIRKILRAIRRWLGPTNAERHQAGREYARAAIQQGPRAIAILRNHIDSDWTFGSRDPFTDGAEEALDQWEKLESKDKA